MKSSIERKRLELKSDMTIIAIQGKSKTGKTQCLQKLIHELGKNNTFTCLFPKNQIKYNELIQNDNPVTNDNNNLVDFIVYGKVENETVGIITYGDDYVSLVNSFYDLKDCYCKLYVCACRSHGETIKLLEELTLNGKLIVHNRWAVSEDAYREKTITIQAEEIRREIEELLK